MTCENEPLLTEEKLGKIDNNPVIVEFLRYILIRDAKHRPTIDNVMRKFEQVQNLLVGNI